MEKVKEYGVQLHFDLNMKYGILIVHIDSSSKKQIVLYLCKEHIEFEKIMIGNSIQDFLDSKLVKQFGVINGDSEYLDKCDKISTLPLT